MTQVVEHGVDDAKPQPPWSLQRYEPLGLLGRGSFGDVYLAHDRLRLHQVALKVLRQWNPTSLAALRREFRALNNVAHPNLVTLYELHADERDGFITMEVVEGQNLVAYVRAAPNWNDRSRLARECLAQLFEGINALHEQNTLHRDIKPSNALVTEGGRVIVLDAGLAKSIDAQRSSQRYVCGTPAYMSPEQAFGRSLDEASDYYSIGVVAHELFTGRVPFESDPRGVLYAKVTGAAPSIAELCPQLSARDANIIDALLSREPEQRPEYGAIREWLMDDVSRPRTQRAAPLRRKALAGRTRELAVLDSALDAARRDGLAVATVAGASGIGKTVLVEHWLSLRDPTGTAVLSGRCYQQETVLFAGFEEIFDAVANRLNRADGAPTLDSEEVASIEAVLGERLPVGAPPMPFDPTIRENAAPPEPLERRRVVGRALARLVQSLVGSSTAVLWLDDLQWGGIETAMLLSDLAHARWTHGCLLVLSHRPEDAGDGGCIAALNRSLSVTHSVELGPLTVTDAMTLVRLTASRSHLPDEAVERLARDTGGHPLLLEQATRHLAMDGRLEACDLGSILRARLRDLPADAQSLLRVLCVAAEPVSEVTALSASGLGVGSDALRQLLVADLVRRVGRVGHCLVPFHDQLRQVVAGELSAAERSKLSLAIAGELEKNGEGQPETLVGYYLAAGERVRAAHFISSAATHMARSLAFDRAAKLFRLSLELATELGNEETLRIRLGLADALVNSGRVEEGARLRLQVAEARGGREADRLVGQAATELIRAGCVDEGLNHARRTFTNLGLSLASNGIRALPSIALDRARLKLRGLRYELRPASAVPARLLEQIDWCQSLTMVLPVVDTLRGLQAHNQGFRWALEAGEPSRLAQALAMEAAFRMALAGGRDPDGKAQELLETARLLAEGSGDPRAKGVVEIVIGSSRWSAGDWHGCVRHIGAGVATLRRNCVGISWEVNFGQTHALDALAWLGELQRKRKILSEEIEHANARGDLYAETMYTIRDLPTQHLVDDRVDDARACEKALERWPNRGFQVEHMANLYKQTEVDLYEGCGTRASARVEDHWPLLARAQLMRLQPFRIEMLALRGRAAVAAAWDQGSGRERHRLVRIAAKASAQIDAEPASIRGAVFGAPLAAGVRCLAGDLAGAAARLRTGIEAANESKMRLYEETLRFELGRLTGGESGRQAIAQAERWMRSQGMRNPPAYSRMICPGIQASS